MHIARKAWDRFRGAGEAAVTVPSMDGALRPNNLLEEARLVVTADLPDNLAVHDGQIYFTSRNRLIRIDRENGAAAAVCEFDTPVSALAISPAGAFAVGLDNGAVLIRGGGHDDWSLSALGSGRSVCPTSLMFVSENELVVAQGSTHYAPSEWKSDLMLRGATGSLWRIGLADGKQDMIAENLGWPYGITLAADGAFVVTESWKHRVLIVDGNEIRIVLQDLPGYPARIAAARDGGYWLSIFAPRNQLIEFIQREPRFLKRMMSEIEPDYWAAPSLHPSSTFLEPLQGGAQKHLGMLKPWAPTRSYGLVARLDANFDPVASYHSRADGARHGVTSIAEVTESGTGSTLFAACKGGGVVVAPSIGARISGKAVLDGISAGAN